MNTEKNLHIVCLDVPWPVDYGGVFDLFYKIKSLSEAGVQIYLHCFEYGRGHQPELNKYCVEVNYYSRRNGLKGYSPTLPYIVSSRKSNALLNRLQEDTFPIFLEGIHCTNVLQKDKFNNRKIFVRLHNVEHLYYGHLANTTQSFLKKIYYKKESKRLKKYEASLKGKAIFFTVNDADKEIFEKKLGYKSIENIPPFLPPYMPHFNGEQSGYCLYHGNLSVAENEKAAIWLLQDVFSKINIPLVIAGKNPSKKLQQLILKKTNASLVSNPDEDDMQTLINKAQINILPSFNATGIKLKLINALYTGQHCLVNNAAVEGTGLDACCSIANGTEETINSLEYLFQQPYSYPKFVERVDLLRRTFSNEENTKKLIDRIFMA